MKPPSVNTPAAMSVISFLVIVLFVSCFGRNESACFHEWMTGQSAMRLQNYLGERELASPDLDLRLRLPEGEGWGEGHRDSLEMFAANAGSDLLRIREDGWQTPKTPTGQTQR